MNKAYGKIFVYELRRMVISWLFFTMLTVNGVFAWYVLTTDVLMGIAHTAPFSIWSYCAYIGKTMPVVMVTILLLLSGYYGKKQKQAEILLSAAPVTMAQHLLIRTVVLGICFVIICAVQILLAAVFYGRFFQYGILARSTGRLQNEIYTGYGFASYLIPSLLILIPCFLFVVGLGHFAGRLHVGGIYLMAVILFAIGFVAVTNVFDFYGAGYFSTYPLTLEAGVNGEPEYGMEAVWVLARLLYGCIGGVFVFFSVRSMERKPTKA